MAFNLTKARALPIGVDLGTAVLKMAQLTCSGKTLELTAAACAEVPEPCRTDLKKRLEFLGVRLRDLVKSNSFKGRQCVMALPASVALIQHVKTAKMPPAELDKVLRWEMQGKLPFDANDAIIRYLVAGEVYSERESVLEVIVVAAARQVVETYLEMAGRSKLEVVALDVEPCAILECFARLFHRPEDSRRVNLFLDFGHANTQVVIARGSRMVFSRNLMVGARQMDEAAGAALKQPAEDIRRARERLSRAGQSSPEADAIYEAIGEAMETMAGEITKCLHYYDSVFPSAAVERAIFLGGQAMDRRLCGLIAQRLNLPAQIGDPLARIGRSNEVRSDLGLHRREPQPAWAVAVGLGLGATIYQAA
jgi:type IV pilus assembly protein PilM